MHKGKVKNRGIKSQNATTDYLLSKKNLIYKWIVSGLTIGDVAEKLGVSRSWLFEQFASVEELNAVKTSAFDARREKLSNNIYKLALGTYKTTVKTRNKSTVIDDSGESETKTIISEETVEHIDDSHYKALVFALSMTESDKTKTIEDKVSIVDDVCEINSGFEYCDVESFISDVNNEK